ncbi:penicillin-binding protein 2 [Deferribacter autotrophicus]|uniref:Penicillin-binding protein 2 n=1 Tax=Deferribacter autotrophicus TaxID=500465 RepID=A0A5A8F747_9BACT|nr:penicillin-binding protein 2 [Deferribacter autotrophicus]KAA0257855.1 penicillin-binding protein 2 [Deferribacter autotrophicus]
MLSERGKIGFVSFVVILLCAVIVVRLVYLQMYKHDYYEDIVKRQSFKEIKIKTERGKIYDTNGVLLAKENNVASVFVYGLDKKEVNYIKKRLKKFGVRKKIRDGNFHWLARNIGIDTARKISAISSNINYVITKHRFYPFGTSFSQIIGFTGVDNQGLSGVEGIYEKYLKGNDISFTFLKDSRNRLIMNSDYRDDIQNNRYIKLTVDSKLQRMSEAVLIEDLEKFRAKRGIVLVIDVKSGEIVVSVSKPDFDPNEFKRFDKETWKNYATQYTFEPGSIFKPVTFSYLLNNYKLNLNKTIDCENGRYRVYGHVYNDVHRYDKIKISEVLIHSSNVGTIKLMEKVSDSKFYNYLRKLGFGKKVNVVGALEERGILRDYKSWSKLSKYSISIGQEIYVTPIQMIRFYAAVANGGYYIKPTFIKEIYYGDGFLKVKSDIVRVFDERVAKKLQHLLRMVVIEGTGQNANSDYVAIAGKTGTAQKFDKLKGSYSTKDYVASFAGFFPYDKPKYAMIVIYDSPRKSIYGGSTAALTFKRIAEQIMLLNGEKIRIYRVSDESKRAA